MPQLTTPDDPAAVVIWMWDYKVLVLDGLPAAAAAAALTAAGREGWELVTVLGDDRLAYLKRLSGEVGILALDPAALERLQRLESGGSAAEAIPLPADPAAAPDGAADGRIPPVDSDSAPRGRLLRFAIPPRQGGQP